MSTVTCAHTSSLPNITLPARPEAIALPPTQSALIVVDMQNAYATEGVIWILLALMSPPQNQ